jgi:hypothetical protein
MDTGLGFVQPMFFIGVVEDRNDPRLEGRVRVRAFGVHGSNQDIPTNELPWATLIIGSHDVNFTPPPLNAWVFGFFIDGRDAQQPMILGLIPAQSLSPVDPSVLGWGAHPAENYDRHMQGARARDIGTSPMSNLATGEFLNETYNASLEVNRAREIPIAGGGARNYAPNDNGNSWTDDRGETGDGTSRSSVNTRTGEQIPGNALERATTIANRLKQDLGLSDAAAAAVAGNILKETGNFRFFQEIRPISGRGGIGWLQWTGTRRDNFEEFSRRNGLDIRSDEANYRFLVNELSREWSSGSSLAAFRSIRDVNAASDYFTRNNLRPYFTNPRFAISEQDTARQFQLRRGASEQVLGTTGQESSQTTEPSVEQSRNDRAREIRERIAEIDAILERSRYQTLDPPERAEIERLETEKAQLEEELRSLEPNATTETQAGEPYRGYMDPPDIGQISTWEEPASAYGAQYPFNRVIETASGHSIELDDTPGAERIMIWHNDGSYIQISSTATTHKSMSDSYNIHERNHHVYVKGTNILTIDGDCHVLVKGNKIEEIQGDYRQIVHGSVQIGAARSVEINGAARTDIRSASLGLDSNVENLNIRTSQNITFESGDSISFKSRNITIGASENTSIIAQNGLFLQSNQNMHIKAVGNMFVNPAQNLFMRADGGTISMQSVGSIRLNAGTFASIKSSSTMELQADANLSMKSNATINMSSNGLISLKSDTMFLDSGAGNLNAKSGGEMRLQSTGDMNIKGQTTKIEGEGDFDIKSGSSLSFESGSGTNILSGGLMKITGSEVHVRGSTTYIDDVIQLASGGALISPGAIAATGADVKAQIDPAPYSDEFDGFDVSPEADSAPEASIPIGSQSAAAGPAAPPQPSIPNQLTEQRIGPR